METKSSGWKTVIVTEAARYTRKVDGNTVKVAASGRLGDLWYLTKTTELQEGDDLEQVTAELVAALKQIVETTDIRWICSRCYFDGGDVAELPVSFVFKKPLN